MKPLPNYFYPTYSLQSKLIIYALLDPETLEIRYIGKSCSGFHRVRQHFNKQQLKDKNKKSNWLKSLLSQTKYPLVSILDYAFDKVNLSKLEIKYIAQHKTEKLLNMTTGGDGYGYKRKNKAVPWNKGKNASQEAKVAMRYAKLGRKFKPRTVEEKVKISKSNIESHLKESKPFICLENSKVYLSQREAAIDLNLDPANISGVLNGHKKTTKGYSFKFYVN